MAKFNKVILGRDLLGNSLVKCTLDNKICIGTTAGLEKISNEDRVGFSEQKSIVSLAVADGHWGDDAAEKSIEFLLNDKISFESIENSVRNLEKLEKNLFKLYERDWEHGNIESLTPEAAFALVQVFDEEINIISYGDCRVFICREGKIIFDAKTSQTWIGVFSYEKLRSRLPIKNSVEFKNLKVLSGDIVCLLTDGVTECKYGIPTISVEYLASLTKDIDSLESFIVDVFSRITENGAEDNASLVVYQV